MASAASEIGEMTRSEFLARKERVRVRKAELEIRIEAQLNEKKELKRLQDVEDAKISSSHQAIEDADREEIAAYRADEDRDQKKRLLGLIDRCREVIVAEGKTDLMKWKAEKQASLLELLSDKKWKEENPEYNRSECPANYRSPLEFFEEEAIPKYVASFITPTS